MKPRGEMPQPSLIQFSLMTPRTGEGVVMEVWTETLKSMKPRGDTVDFLQAEIMGTTFQT
jgi:hypothetical protein